MNSKKWVLLIAGALLVSALWLRSWLKPERQIIRAQARFLSCVERRDFAAMAGWIAPDYRDRWQQDRTSVIERSREVFGQFLTLNIEHGGGGIRAESGRFFLSEKVVIKGFGGPLATAARDAVNALHAPFVTEWRRRGWKPWEWELKSVEQPELELP